MTNKDFFVAAYDFETTLLHYRMGKSQSVVYFFRNYSTRVVELESGVVCGNNRGYMEEHKRRITLNKAEDNFAL